ncbi:hypothetical protein P8822_00200 [Bacillus sonorensis]|uniref:hypothetical protein n=1 Tax=Bacillus sonorensis TaxID=119858 RepID=UPI002DB74DD8|nr:hypothetical protein [Bacillus sonorensis]MEC0526235.1 hypothetical protein [Bacillus sonorensis]
MDKLKLVLTIIILTLLGINIVYEVNHQKEIEKKTVSLTGTITDKKVEEGRRYATHYNYSTGTTYPVLVKDGDYYFIVSVENEQYKCEVEADVFNSKKIGQKVKVKKYENEIKLAD